MAKIGWGYKVTNFKRTKEGIVFDLIISESRKWYLLLKYLLFKMQINIRINHVRDR